MKTERAIEIIKDELPFESGVINEAIQMVEKQLAYRTPKKPIRSSKQKFEYTVYYDCPNCGKSFAGASLAAYCYHCGQKLDWGGKE